MYHKYMFFIPLTLYMSFDQCNTIRTVNCIPPKLTPESRF